MVDYCTERRNIKRNFNNNFNNLNINNKLKYATMKFLIGIHKFLYFYIYIYKYIKIYEYIYKFFYKYSPMVDYCREREEILREIKN